MPLALPASSKIQGGDRERMHQQFQKDYPGSVLGDRVLSSLELVTFLQELLYNKVFDAILRQAIKPSSHPEILQELESVQDAWKHVCSMRANELEGIQSANSVVPGLGNGFLGDGQLSVKSKP